MAGWFLTARGPWSLPLLGYRSVGVPLGSSRVYLLLFWLFFVIFLRTQPKIEAIGNDREKVRQIECKLERKWTVDIIIAMLIMDTAKHNMPHWYYCHWTYSRNEGGYYETHLAKGSTVRLHTRVYIAHQNGSCHGCLGYHRPTYSNALNTICCYFSMTCIFICSDRLCCNFRDIWHESH